MELRAISTGCAVPEGAFDAEVHSVFTSAANLRLLKSGALITLVVVTEPDLPQGIRVDAPVGFSFETLRPGERFACREGVLSCPEAELTIDLKPAARWKCDLTALSMNMNDPATSTAWRTAASMLIGRWVTEESRWMSDETAMIREMDEIVPDLVEASRLRDELAAEQSVARLIGLGPGLTPACDDFLVGFLTGLWCSANGKAERARFIFGLAKEVSHLSRRTNDISRAYLFHAAHGQVSSRLADLAGAICRGESHDRVQRAVEASMQVGHVSGLAATTGLLVGLSVWEGLGSMSWIKKGAGRGW